MPQYMRIPRRNRYIDDEDFVVFDTPRKRRRRRATAPDVADLISYTEETLEALQKYQEKQKEKYTPKKTDPKGINKIPVPVGLAITFFLSPIIWLTVGSLFYQWVKITIMGE